MIWVPTRLAPGGALPEYKSEGAAGLDLRAHLPHLRILWPLVPTRIPTGVAMAIPDGFCGHIVGRSGLAMRGLCMLGGLIDSDYRGEMQAIVVLLRLWPMIVRPGDRIAQIVLVPAERANLSLHLPMTSTARGANGLGSTGVR